MVQTCHCGGLSCCRVQTKSVSLVVAKEFSGAVACVIFPNQGLNPASAGRFLTTGPPGKSSCDLRETFKILEIGLPAGPVVRICLPMQGT